MDKELTPRRRRTIRDAEAMLGRELDLSPTEKCRIMPRIRAAPQPRREARRIIEYIRSQDVGNMCRHNGTVDQSDVQELLVKLINKYRVIFPPHRTWYMRLARRVAKGPITPAQFRAEAAALLAMKPALPKLFLEAESALLGE